MIHGSRFYTNKMRVVYTFIIKNVRSNMKEIIRALYEDSEKFPKEAIEKARANKGKINDYLLEELEKIVSHLSEDNLEIPFFADYAIFLLAEFKEKRTCPLLLKMVDIPNADSFDYVGIGVMDKLPSILASVFDGNYEALNGIIENKELDDFTRNRVLKVYQYFYKHEMITKEELITYLRKLIVLYEYDDPIYDMIRDIVAECHIFEMISDVQEMFDRGTIDCHRSGDYADFIDDIFDYDPRYQEEVYCIDDIEKSMRHLYSFEDNENENLVDKMVDMLQKDMNDKMITSKKVGRNDLCPCGSGKKFKKCCLDKVNNTLPYQKYITESLARYPKKNNNKEEQDFYTYYKEECIKIDELLYRAMKEKRIPMYIQRNISKELDIAYMDLRDAYVLIKEQIDKYKFKTIEEYDASISIHFSLYSFFKNYSNCMISKIERGKKEYLSDLEEFIQYFYDGFSINPKMEYVFLEIIDDYYELVKNYEEAIVFFENKLVSNPYCKYDIAEYLFNKYNHVYNYNETIKKMEEIIGKETDADFIEYLEELKMDYMDDELEYV